MKLVDIIQHFVKILMFNMLIIFAIQSKANDTIPDSIANELNQVNENQKAAIYNKNADTLLGKDNKLALQLSEKALEYALKYNNEEEIFKAKKNIGHSYYNENQYKKSLEYFEQLIQYIEESDNKKEKQDLNNTLGGAYFFIGEYEKAHSHFFKALEYAIAVNDKEEIGNIYGNIASVYLTFKNYEKATEYANLSIKINLETNNLGGLSTSYTQLANIYFEEENYIKTIEYNLKSLEVKKRRNDISGIATSYNNIAAVYFKVEDYKNAMKYYNEALQIYDSLGDLRNLTMVNSNIGFTIECMGKPLEALEYYKRSYEIAKSIDYNSQILFLIESFAVIYDSVGNYKLAYQYKDSLLLLKDSLFTIEKHQQMSELEAKFQNTQKESQIQLLNKDAKIREEKLRSRNILTYSFAGSSVLLILLSFFIWRSFKLKKKANQKLREQNCQIMEKNEELQQQREEILTQREEIEKKSEYLQEAYETIERKNQNITDSIIYAKKIQNALLKNTAKIESVFKEFFIFHKSKDIVSGDFYWTEKIDNRIFIAAIDCTGHGVPGAFMSIIANNLLNQIIIQDKNTEANEILNELNTGLHKALHNPEQENNIKDGMDLALCVIDLKTKKIQYSGAHNSIYLLRQEKMNSSEFKKTKFKVFFDDAEGKTMIEFKPDKYPIGKYFAEEFTSFSFIEFDYIKNDTIYMFSDGFADQFGGDANRKFMYNRFRDMLIKNSNLPLAKQKEIFETTFFNWKGNYDQIDDVLLLGFKMDTELP